MALRKREGYTIANDVYIQTGRKVELPVIHNTEPAPYLGERYDQHIEPKGLWVIERDPGYEPWENTPWVEGTVRFASPLVIEFVETRGKNGWKRRLHEHFKAKGRALTNKIRRAGYDGIITVTSHANRRLDTREIVDLNPMWNPRAGRRR